VNVCPDRRRSIRPHNLKVFPRLWPDGYDIAITVSA
jgi:hypothetical protein